MKYVNNLIHFKIIVFMGILLIYGCGIGKKVSLEYLDGYGISGGHKINNTIFGGISGIDYDTNNDLIFLVSDDRSKFGPARMYELQLTICVRSI